MWSPFRPLRPGLGIGFWTGRAISTRYLSGGNWGQAPHPLTTLPSGPGWNRPPSRILHRHRKVRAIESLFRKIVRFFRLIQNVKDHWAGHVASAETRGPHSRGPQVGFWPLPTAGVQKTVQIPLADPEISRTQSDVWKLAVPAIVPDGVPLDTELLGHLCWLEEPVGVLGFGYHTHSRYAFIRAERKN